MHFSHSNEIWRDYPALVPAVLLGEGITTNVSVVSYLAKFNAIGESRLASHSEGELPEIQAWRRVFSSMGLKPTQYRCASESLLRRFRKEKSLPQLHPLIDLCNSVSLAYAIPIAIFDLAKISEYLEVQYATGEEIYLTFSGEVEHPERGEVIFADKSGRGHARRWTNRQSGYSAVCDATSTVLIVAEAMHSTAQKDMHGLTAALADALKLIWSSSPKTRILSKSTPRFEF